MQMEEEYDWYDDIENIHQASLMNDFNNFDN